MKILLISPPIREWSKLILFLWAHSEMIAELSGLSKLKLQEAR
jgi:hypothetical protein